MDAVCSHLAASQDITLGAKVQRAHLNDAGKWLLEGEVSRKMNNQSQRVGSPPHTPWNLGVFDGLVLADAMVARQGAPGYVTLQGADLSSMMSRILSVGSSPLFSLMLALDASEPLLPFDAATVSGSETISWVAQNTSKPGRQRSDSLQCWVVITTAEFAAELIGSRGEGGALPPQTPEYLAAIAPRIWEALLVAMQPALRGRQLPEPVFMQCQRWAAAVPVSPVGEACLWDSHKVVACGDFCFGGGVENAIVSGLAAAGQMRGMFEA